MSWTHKKIEEAHDYWCQWIRQRLERVVHHVPTPSIIITNDAYKWAGVYLHKSHTCKYSLPYAIVAGDKYDETIAHEVCHAFQFKLQPNSIKHGDLFFFLFHNVCEMSRNQFHEYDVKKAKKVAALLKLREAMV